MKPARPREAAAAKAASQALPQALSQALPILRGASLIAALLFAGTPAQAQDICSDLWFERNQIYKDAGYCFKTSRAIRAFGNAGCTIDDLEAVPLTSAEQRRVNQIVRMERSYGCRR